MKIHEYQAKAILKDHGVPVPRGEVADSVAEARTIAETLGGTVVVKAQIHAGGRGKGTFKHGASGETVMRPAGDKPLGGVVVVDGPDAAEKIAGSMLGNILVTKQSGAEGREVRHVLIEEGMDIASEFYLAILLDRSTKSPVFIASAEGGTEIEEVAAERPEAILRITVDPRVGMSPWIGRRIAFGLGLGEHARDVVKMTAALYEMFMTTDAPRIELIGRREGVGRADVETAPAVTAAIAVRGIGSEVQVGEERP